MQKLGWGERNDREQAVAELVTVQALKHTAPETDYTAMCC